MLNIRTHSNISTKHNRKVLRNNATPQEIILWSRLRKNILGYKFQRQHGIGKYIVDFYCSSQKLIIEIDGIQHNDIKDKDYDIKRTKYFESLGFNVLRFWNNEINTNTEGVVMKIQEMLK